MPRRGTGAYVEGLPANAVIGLLFTRATRRRSVEVLLGLLTDASYLRFEGPQFWMYFLLLSR